MAELKRSDFSKICRTCLLQKENMEPIYKSDIPKMLLSFTNIKVDTEDEFPKLICLMCSEKIVLCSQFKKQCETSEDILKSILDTDSKRLVDNNSSTKTFIKEFKYDSPSETENDCHTYSSPQIKIEKSEEEDKKCENKPRGARKRFLKKSTLTKRTKSHTKTKVKVTVKKDTLKKNIVNDKNNCVCDICGKRVSRSDYLKYHRQNHFLTARYNCDICDAKFRSITAMRKHKIYKHGGPRKKELCNLCDRLFYNLPGHIKLKHTKEKDLRYKCTEDGCVEKFPFEYALKAHIRKKHRGEKLSRIDKLCTICGKVLHSEKGYEYHMLFHSGEKPFMCEHCHMGFRSLTNLKLHKRRHSDERPYKCTYCENAFRSKGVLLRHTLIHTGEKPFACQICNKTFRQKVTLTTHMKIH